MTWMRPLKWVFAIDTEAFPKCGGTLRVITCVGDPNAIGHATDGFYAPLVYEQVALDNGAFIDDSSVDDLLSGPWPVQG